MQRCIQIVLENINILTWQFGIGCSLFISLVNHYKNFKLCLKTLITILNYYF
jgi:hypothetical protein